MLIQASFSLKFTLITIYWWILIQIPWLWTAQKKLLDHCDSQKTPLQTSWRRTTWIFNPNFWKKTSSNPDVWWVWDHKGCSKTFHQAIWYFKAEVIRIYLNKNNMTFTMWPGEKKTTRSVVFRRGFFVGFQLDQLRTVNVSHVPCVSRQVFWSLAGVTRSRWEGVPQPLLFRLLFGEKFWSKKNLSKDLDPQHSPWRFLFQRDMFCGVEKGVVFPGFWGERWFGKMTFPVF